MRSTRSRGVPTAFLSSSKDLFGEFGHFDLGPVHLLAAQTEESEKIGDLFQKLCFGLVPGPHGAGRAPKLLG